MYSRNVIAPCQEISLGFAWNRLDFRSLEHLIAALFQRKLETRSVPLSQYGFRRGINIDTRFNTSRHFPLAVCHGCWICANPPFHSRFTPFEIPINHAPISYSVHYKVTTVIRVPMDEKFGQLDIFLF